MSTFSVTCCPSKASGACAPAAVAARAALQRRGTEACTDAQATRLSGRDVVLASMLPLITRELNLGRLV